MIKTKTNKKSLTEYDLAQGILDGYTDVWYVDKQASFLKFEIKIKNANIKYCLPHGYRKLYIEFSSFNILNEFDLKKHLTCKLYVFCEKYFFNGDFFFEKKYALRNMKQKINKLKKYDKIILYEAENYIEKYPEYFI